MPGHRVVHTAAALSLLLIAQFTLGRRGAQVTIRPQRQIPPHQGQPTGMPGYHWVAHGAKMRFWTARTRIGAGQPTLDVAVQAADCEGTPVVSGRQRFSIISDGLPTQLPDIDPDETREWLESFDDIVRTHGRTRARYVMLRLLERARERQVGVPGLRSTDYINTIPPESEPWFPGDEYVERRIRAYIRWNAAVMVSRANKPGLGVGGHIATYASAASLYEVGYNHFFRGKDHGESGDQVFFQGHAAPGIYARAFLEGRLTEQQLNGFRQELSTP